MNKSQVQSSSSTFQITTFTPFELIYRFREFWGVGYELNTAGVPHGPGQVLSVGSVSVQSHAQAEYKTRSEANFECGHHYSKVNNDHYHTS